MRCLSLLTLVLLAVGCSRSPPVEMPPPELPSSPLREATRSAGESPQPTRPQKAELAGATPVQVPAPQPEPAHSFANDKGSQLIAELLRPAEEVVTRHLRRDKPLPLPGPAHLERPSLRLPELQTALPHVDLVQRQPLLAPRSVGEGPPLAQQKDTPPRPTDIVLPAELVPQRPSADPMKPAPLPVLAQPKPDPAPLTDPSTASSQAVVLKETIPVRTTPAPFTPVNVPDPFPYRLPRQLRTVEGESPMPPIHPALPPPRRK